MDKPMIPPDGIKLVEVPPESAPKSRLSPELVIPDKVVHVPAAMVPITGVISTTPSTPAGVGAGMWVSVERAIDAFLAGGVDSLHTRRAYGRHLRDAFALLGIDDIRDLTGEHLAAYRAHLLEDGRGPSTKTQALAAMRKFLRWASATRTTRRFDREVLQATLKSPRAQVINPYTVLTEPEVGRLIKATNTLRDRAIVMTLLGAGPRVNELVHLDVGDLRHDADGGDILHIREGKGSRDRLVPVREDVSLALHQYLLGSGRTTASLGPLFLAHDRAHGGREHRRVGVRSIRKLIKVLRLRAGIAKRVTPHSLRHSFAIRALRYSGNLVAVSKMLGHRSIATTQTYLNHLGLGELRRAIPPLPVEGPLENPEQN